MSIDEINFDRSLQGYNKDQVNKAIQELKRELVIASSQLTEVSNENARLKQELKDIQTDLSQSGSPSYAGLGSKLEQVLRTAEEQSIRLISESEQQATQLRQQTQLEVDQLKTEAENLYQDKLAQAQQRADEIISEAKEYADHLLAQAKEQADEVAKDALREVAAIRGAVSTESAELRAQSKREAEVISSEALREITEQKVIAQRELGEVKSLIEDYNKQAAQARLDLEMELTARRAQADAEFLEKHQHASSETQKFLDEANQQLSLVIQRMGEKREELSALETATRVANQQSIDQAKEEARKIVEAAQAEARRLTAKAKTENAELEAETEKRLAQLREERDAIANYFAGLNQLLSEAKKVPAPTKTSAKSTAAEKSSASQASE